MGMNEVLRINPPKNTSRSQLLRHTLQVTLMGILSSCAVQKPVSTDGLTKYPSAWEMLKKPFYSEASQDIRNLSHFYLESAEAQNEYVNDDGIIVSEVD